MRPAKGKNCGFFLKKSNFPFWDFNAQNQLCGYSHKVKPRKRKKRARAPLSFLIPFLPSFLPSFLSSSLHYMAAGANAEPAKKSWKVKLRDYWVNDGPKVVFMFVFFAVNAAVFLERFIRMFFMLLI